MSWYKKAAEYSQIAHENYILWFSNDSGRITTSEPQSVSKNQQHSFKSLHHNNWKPCQDDVSESSYRGRYDTVRKIITVIGGNAEDLPRELVNGLMSTFPDAKTMYVFDAYNSYKAMRLR